MISFSQLAPASMAGVALMVAPMSSGNFPNPEDPAPPVGQVVPQLPAPYETQIEGACEVASIPCVSPNLSSGLGYTIESGYFRARLLEGTQLNSALNVEVVLEVRDENAAYGVIELLPVCVVLDADGDLESWSLNGSGGTYAWADLEAGDVVDDEYIALLTDAECDPLLERRDILTIATWTDSPDGLAPSLQVGWVNLSTDGWGDAPWEGVEKINNFAPTTLCFVMVDVIDAPDYGEAGTVTLRYTWEGRAYTGAVGSFCTNPASITVYNVDDSPGDLLTGDLTLGTSTAWSFVGPDLGMTRDVTWDVDAMYCVKQTGTTPCEDSRAWFAAGSAENPGATVYTASSLTAYDVFAAIIHRPWPEGSYMSQVEGYCADGFENCLTSCGSPTGIGDVFTWVGCMFTPQLDIDGWWRAVQLEVTRSRFSVDVQTLGTYIFSPLRAVGNLGRTCGEVSLIPTSTGNEIWAGGYGINTCTLQEGNPELVSYTWAILVAMAFFGGAIAIVRIFEGALGLRDPLIGEDKKA